MLMFRSIPQRLAEIMSYKYEIKGKKKPRQNKKKRKNMHQQEPIKFDRLLAPGSGESKPEAIA